MFAFDGFEEGFEVADAEAEGAVAFDEFEEHGGAVDEGFGEDLQQVAVFVAVDEDAAFLQFLDRGADVADPRPQVRILVVGVGGGQEFDALGDQ